MMANGEFAFTLPPAPICILSLTIAKKVNRKKIAKATKVCGERNIYLNSFHAILSNMIIPSFISLDVVVFAYCDALGKVLRNIHPQDRVLYW